MAEIVTIEGQEFKRRSPLGVWGLSVITLGIYSWVWYYKINDEAKRYLRDETIRPGIAVLAVTLGAIVIVPAFISIYRTGERIQRMQENAKITQRTEPVIGLIAFLVYLLHVPYYQSGLNRIWDAYGVGAQPPQAPPVPPPPATQLPSPPE
jgi:Domain of unknown function (DUF4234)